MTGFSELRKPTTIQRINSLIPALILAVLGWMALQVVDIPVIKHSLASMQKELKDHNDASKALSGRNSADHHRARGMTPCDGCHDK